MKSIKKVIGILISLMLASMLMPSVLSSSSASAQSPFATEVVDHSTDIKHPGAVLGEPTKETTTYSGNPISISMVYPAGDGKVTTINEDSYIEVKFDHKVKNDPNNPFGIDFIVFGNSFYIGKEGMVAPDTNMEDYHIKEVETGGKYPNMEPVLVAVSQDGENWYKYTDGPYADTGFPTNPYKWDRQNDTWGDQLDFTKPVDPSIDTTDFVGMSVADVIDTYYKDSAGGTGFDLAPSGYEWIRYIKVYGTEDYKGGEVDAFADVSPAPEEEEATTQEIINYGSIEDAVGKVRELGTTKAARILGSVRGERAGEVLSRLKLEERKEIALAMSNKSLKRVLPEVNPQKLYEMPPKDLFDKLPDVPAEQLVKEVPPEPCPDIAPPNKIEETSSKIIVQAPEVRSGKWVNFFSKSNLTFTSLSLKSVKDLKDVKASIETLRGGTPAGVRWPSHGYPYKCLFFKISLENIQPDEVGAMRVTFKLEKDSLDFMNHNKFSILLNRWNDEEGEWISIPAKRISEDSDSVHYSAIIPGFCSIFCITGSKEIPTPKYEFSNLSISPAEATVGSKVTISADIANLTKEAKSCPVTLWINQTAESCQEVRVPAGGKTQVSFTVGRNEPGEYKVRIGRLMDSFTLKKAPDKTPPEIVSFSPSGVVEKANPNIEAEYSDARSGIDKNTVKLLLDGQNVTSKAKVTQSKVNYAPTEWMEEGKHTVKLEVADLEGNKSSREWDFNLDVELRLPGQRNIARDLDGDGLYEDVNGDGKANSDDRHILFRNLASTVVQRKAARFDFNGDGIVDVGDVFALPTTDIPSSLALVAGKVQCEPGEVACVPITIYHAKNGVSAFSLKISLEGGKVIPDKITHVNLPDYGMSWVSGKLPGQEVVIQAVDLSDSIQAGMKKAVLAKLKIKGSVSGESDIKIDLQSIYDEQGKAIEPDVTRGKVQIQ